MDEAFNFLNKSCEMFLRSSKSLAIYLERYILKYIMEWL